MLIEKEVHKGAKFPTGWKKKFAYFPTVVHEEGSKRLSIWWEYYEERVLHDNSISWSIERKYGEYPSITIHSEFDPIHG
jgi:hypothetical protein